VFEIVGDTVGDDCATLVTPLKSTVVPDAAAVAVNSDVISLHEVFSILFAVVLSSLESTVTLYDTVTVSDDNLLDLKSFNLLRELSTTTLSNLFGAIPSNLDIVLMKIYINEFD
jgi:hypothetical protein